MPDSVTWATIGMGRVGSSGVATIAPGYDPSITADATSTYVGGVLTGCVMPATVDATSVVGSPICPIVGSGIATITSYSTTSEGVP